MNKTEATREQIAKIIRDGVKYEPQTGSVIIHGAIDEIAKLVNNYDRLVEALQSMVDTYEYEASSENPSLLKAKSLLKELSHE